MSYSGRECDQAINIEVLAGFGRPWYDHSDRWVTLILSLSVTFRWNLGGEMAMTAILIVFTEHMVDSFHTWLSRTIKWFSEGRVGYWCRPLERPYLKYAILKYVWGFYFKIQNFKMLIVIQHHRRWHIHVTTIFRISYCNFGRALELTHWNFFSSR